ncbi:GSCFA domain-containing protein [Urechidicola croceus]|uniref:GSCFA domain-containing protein n=1 Tax=Urechidicola croceus TaxID=1850246 RepID=A0A1D8P8A8_9FLAO|nr:GSCFA domain-containing protein [Urechidicola croceus]AOW20800.1 GSCFA domain-containing protein [Urechidicola croceus]
MNFRTQIPLNTYTPLSVHKIDYESEILLFGSCFTENIGNKLDYFKFHKSVNPFGILFHPKAIENLITNAVNEKEYKENDMIFHNECWHCFEAHSELSDSSKDELLSILNENINSTYKQLINSSHIIITLGTSWVYRFVETDTIVANCHKIPQKKFLKELLSAEEIIESLDSIVTLVKSINPNCEFIFTVSPVRHLKDGFTENALSKAHLLAAIHQVIEPRKHIHYFPSYEIMMDDLRDYRFYKEDMIHPNETAVNYIWEQFKSVWIDKNTSDLMAEIDTIQKGLAHRPFNKSSKQHQQFLEKLNLKMERLRKEKNIHF